MSKNQKGIGQLNTVAEAASMLLSKRNIDGILVQNTRTVHLAGKDGKTKGLAQMTDKLEESGSKTVGIPFELGYMVWGKIKSYPWWPGQIFDEACAVPSVQETKKEGHVLVAFFGDDSYGWFDPEKLIPFEPHYIAKSKQSSDPDFLYAVKEAEYEVSRRAALGLACHCRKVLAFLPSDVHGFYYFHIRGYESYGVFSLKQIRSARNGFEPTVTLSFVRQLALIPERKLRKSVYWLKHAAEILAYRMAVFQGSHKIYAETFRAERVHPSDSTWVLSQQEQVPSQVHSSGFLEIGEAVKRSKRSKRLASHVDWGDQQKRQYAQSQICNYDIRGACCPIPGKKNLRIPASNEEDVAATGNNVHGGSAFISEKIKNASCLQPQATCLKAVENNHHSQNAKAWGLSLESIPFKKRLKAEDYEKTGQRSSIWNLSEGKFIQGLKISNQLKSSTSENHEHVKSHCRDEKIHAPLAKDQFDDNLQKPKTRRSSSPTLLIMKFPSTSALPSISELKAKFVRFGPLDLSATHVLWKSLTCIIAFKC